MRQGLRLAAIAAILLVSAASCTSIDDQLLVVGLPSSQQTSATIWAVTPGDRLDDDHRVLTHAVGPLTIITRERDGALRNDDLGQAWKGELLLAAGIEDDDPAQAQQVLANQPGGDAATIATAAQAQAVVVPRGVFVFDDQGCRFASGAEKADDVGDGQCSISDDDRWVASWGANGGPMKVRDLRNDEVVTAKGNFTQGVALANDARVLGIDTGDTTSVAKVIDATNGKVVSTGEPASYLQAMPATPDGRAFVVIAERDGIPSLEWIDTDGTTTTIGEGAPDQPLLPVNVGDGLDYLALGAKPDQTRLYHWSPGEAEGNRLMSGEITATPLTPDTTLVTRQVSGGLEFWSIHDGERSAHPHVVLRTDTSDHLQVGPVLTDDGVAQVQVTGPAGSSYVRVDTEGDRSAVILKDWASLQVSSIDADGTVVVTGAKGGPDTGERLMVVGSDDDKATLRATAESFRPPSLVHDGTVYYTEATASGASTVWQVPVSARGGGEKPERLWDDALLGGAAWPQYGGASNANTIDPTRIANPSGNGG